MGNESGKSIVILLILIVLIIIGVVSLINYAKEMIIETNAQDLRTDMLLIQAEAKKGIEEVCFQTVNLDVSKEEDLKKINEAKQQNLDGIILSNAPEEVQKAVENIPDVVWDENCYYLDEETLTEMGIKNMDEEENGYIIVKYNFSNADVEVISTKGYNGKHTLTQIINTSTKAQS